MNTNGSSDKDPPKQLENFRCTAPLVSDPEGREEVVTGPCHDAALKAKTVQCRADWMNHPLTKAMYACAAMHSKGPAQARYEKIVEKGLWGDGWAQAN